jgi:hypothetical protein
LAFNPLQISLEQIVFRRYLQGISVFTIECFDTAKPGIDRNMANTLCDKRFAPYKSTRMN